MNSTILELTLATLLIVLAGIHFAYRSRSPHRASMTDIGIWALLPFFGLSPWISFHSAGALPPLEAGILFQTYGSVVLFALGMMGAAWLIHRSVPSHDIVPPGVVPSRTWIVIAGGSTASVMSVLFFFGLAFAARIVVGVKYGMFLQGDAFSSSLPEWLGDFLLVGELFTSAAVVWAAVTIITTRKNRLIAFIVIILDLALCMGLGRRWLLVDVSIVLFTYFSFKGFNKMLLLRAGIGALIALMLITAFDRTRYYRWTNSQGSGLSAYVEAVKMAIEDPDAARRTSSTTTNYAMRPIQCSRYIAMILTAQEHSASRPYLHGETYLAAVVHSIPYQLFPAKRNWLAVEPLMLSHYNYPGGDYGTTWVVCGVADFGFLGVILGGAFLGSIIATCELLARFLSPKFPFIALCILGVMARYLIQVQDSPSGLIASLRQGIFLALGCIVLMPLFPARWQSGGGVPDQDQDPADSEGYDSQAVGKHDGLAWQ